MIDLDDLGWFGDRFGAVLVGEEGRRPLLPFFSRSDSVFTVRSRKWDPILTFLVTKMSKISHFIEFPFYRE